MCPGPEQSFSLEIVERGGEASSEDAVVFFQAHEAEVWTCRFHPHPLTQPHLWPFSTGGDDGYWKIWDPRILRTTSATLFWRRCTKARRTEPPCIQTKHPAGVTSICPLPHESRTLSSHAQARRNFSSRPATPTVQTPFFLTGCYDGHLRAYDLRFPAQPFSTLSLGGGVWKIDPQPDALPEIFHESSLGEETKTCTLSPTSLFLIAAMDGGAALVSFHPAQGLKWITSTTTAEVKKVERKKKGAL